MSRPVAAPRPVPALPAREIVIDHVRGLAAPVLAEVGVELDRIAWGAAGRRGLLQVFIDRPGGVSIDDCVAVSRQLSDVLDTDEMLTGAYLLEVSSPGLTRPLESEADFRRFEGKLACIKLRVAEDGRYTLVGRLRGVVDGQVRLEGDGGEVTLVRLDGVARATLELEDGPAHVPKPSGRGGADDADIGAADIGEEDQA